MFQTAELGQSVPKKEFKQREIVLRGQLLETQQKLRKDGRFPVLVDFSGVRGAGKGTSINVLNEWMDARWINTQAFNADEYDQRGRPFFWRFWRNLPPRGQIGLHMSGRYTRPLLDYVYGRSDRTQLFRQLDRINSFEQALSDDGMLLQKFWMHISRDVQKSRLETLEADPLRSWRMSPQDWKNWEMYDQFIEAAELIITHTNTGHAPWEIVEGADTNYRHLRVGEVLLQAMERHLVQKDMEQRVREDIQTKINGTFSETSDSEEVKTTAPITVMDGLDLSKSLQKREYREALREGTARLANLQHKAMQSDTSLILVFEGPDASGKGGAIRRVTGALDARYYKVYPFAAPTKVENAHQYLWRFWGCIPRQGRVAIFDRSWYGRVLVERVEGFARDDEWRRAYAEINEFEDQLIQSGIVLRKFWMHISKEEQLKRFEARKVTPHKQWKLCEEDWRNRERWNDYALATNEMIQNTSVQHSPWILVENENKMYGRIKVINSICDALEEGLKGQA